MDKILYMHGRRGMKNFIKFILVAVLFLTAGCISWDEGWKTKVQATGQGDVKALLAFAVSLEGSADSADKILDVIKAYEKVIAVEPANFEALLKLGEFTYLYGYIYARDKKVKEEYYLKSLNYCERAMYTNPEFKKRADQGKTVWESVDTLGSREMGAMFFWYVAAGQSWTECHGAISHLLNFYWPGRTIKVLERMKTVKADWEYGRVYMSWGAYHAILPGFLGGDLDKSAEDFANAIRVAPDALNNYYVRARYLHVKNYDRAAFIKDLEHIRSADIAKLNYPYPWAAAYKMKAKELLSEIDKLF